jgi:hypothetical protein
MAYKEKIFFRILYLMFMLNIAKYGSLHNKRNEQVITDEQDYSPDILMTFNS